MNEWRDLVPPKVEWYVFPAWGSNDRVVRIYDRKTHHEYVGMSRVRYERTRAGMKAELNREPEVDVEFVPPEYREKTILLENPPEQVLAMNQVDPTKVYDYRQITLRPYV